MMIYSILLISSIIVPVNALVFVLPSKCFINFFVDFVALDLTIYHYVIGVCFTSQYKYYTTLLCYMQREKMYKSVGMSKGTESLFPCLLVCI